MPTRRKDAASRRWSRGYRAGKRVAYKALVAIDPEQNKRGQRWSKGYFGDSWNTATDSQRYHRRAFNFKGPGAYFSANPTIAAGLRAGGAWLGRLTGVPGAAEVGRWGAGQASKWLGFGAYNQATSGNQLMVDSSQVPVTVNTGNDETGDVYISHREFIMNVTATAAAAGATPFQQTVIPLNPGLSTSFPFLSQLAQNFELYDFNGLMFQYVPTSGESGAASNSLGKVLMATNYDPDASPFLNSIQMENYDYACSTKPSLGLIHGVETHNGQQVVNMMYVRTSDSSTKDRSFTDIGKFTIATEGIPAAAAGTQIIGELWATYNIKLSRASLYNSLLGLGIPTDWITITPTPTKMNAAVSYGVGNSNLWEVMDATTPSTQLRFRCKNNTLSLGCFQLSFWAYTPTNTNNMAISTVTFNQNCANIFGVAGNAQMYANKVGLELTLQETIFFKVNQSTPGAPAELTLNFGSAFADTSYTVRVLISQISCAVDGTLF